MKKGRPMTDRMITEFVVHEGIYYTCIGAIDLGRCYFKADTEKEFVMLVELDNKKRVREFVTVHNRKEKLEGL